MVEFLISQGHPPEAVQEYSWDKLKLFYEKAALRVSMDKIDLHERMMLSVAFGTGSVHKKGHQQFEQELERIRQERDKLIASTDPMALIKQMTAKLQRGGVKARNG